MALPAAAQIITIGRSEHPEWSPEEVLGWHVKNDDWWSSSQHHGRIWRGITVFVRFVPGGELISRARVLDPTPVFHKDGPEPDLHWRWHPVDFLNETPIRGVFLRDFGIGGWRARPGLIGLSTSEREAIGAALDAGEPRLG
jgi:hypothetical protein